MHVVYRLTDIPSTNPSPVYQENKPELNKFCLESFLEAFKDVDYTITFLCDHCSDYGEYLGKVLPKHNIEYSNLGINGTYMRSLEIAKYRDVDTYFAECDYIYREGAGKKIEAAIECFGYMSGYDHPDKYPTKSASIEFFDGLHWRTAPSTTMTYGVSKQNLRQDYELLIKYGYLDSQMWENLYKETGRQLWTPMPAICSHMVAHYLSPGMSWK